MRGIGEQGLCVVVLSRYEVEMLWDVIQYAEISEEFREHKKELRVMLEVLDSLGEDAEEGREGE